MIIFKCIFLSSDRCVCVLSQGRMMCWTSRSIRISTASARLWSWLWANTRYWPRSFQNITRRRPSTRSYRWVRCVCVCVCVCVFNHSVCRCRRRWIIWCWRAITSCQRRVEPSWDTITPLCWPSSPSCATSSRPNQTLMPHRYKESKWKKKKKVHTGFLAQCCSWRCHILSWGAGNGCQHQEQAPSSHHLYGDHRS